MNTPAFSSTGAGGNTYGGLFQDKPSPLFTTAPPMGGTQADRNIKGAMANANSQPAQMSMAPKMSFASATPIVHPTVKAPVASQTSVHPDGTTLTTKYVAPETGTNPGFIATKSDSAPSTNQQATTGLLNYGQGNNNNPVVGEATGGLIGVGNKAADIASDFGKEYSDAGIQGANAQAGYRTTGTSRVGEGNANVIAQTTAAKQGAISAGEQEALQGLSQQASGYQNAGSLAQGQQGQNIGALGTAASQSAPVTQFGQITNPQTGQVIGADTTGNNPALTNAVATAVQMVKNGAAPADALATLSGYGQAGVNAFNQAQGSGYNPTAANATATSIANTNAALGSQYQTQASNLSTNLSQLTNAGKQAQSFLQGHPQLNSTNTPVGNAQITKYLQQIGDTAAVTDYNAILSDIQKFQSGITSSGTGLTPTQTTSNILSQDPSTMSMPQLNSYIQTLQQLGESQHAVLTGATSNSYYSGGPATGATTNVNTSNVPTPGGGTANLNFTPQQLNQSLAGLGISTVGWTGEQLSKIGGELAGYITRAITTP